jgi:hypothetical protein
MMRRAFATSSGDGVSTRLTIAEQIRRVRSGKESETVTVNGRTVDASAYLNREIADITQEAVFQGVLQPEDLGIPRAARAPFGMLGGLDTGGRFVCEHETRR